MSAMLEPILFGSDLTLVVAFKAGGVVVPIGASPTLLRIVWTPDDPAAAAITKAGTVVTDGSDGQASFSLVPGDYSSLTAPTSLHGVATVTTTASITYTEDLELPIKKADRPYDTGLVTLAAIKEYLSIIGDASDNLLTRHIKSASEQIESMTGRSVGGFKKQSFSEDFDGSDTDTFLVRNPPIASISSVNVLEQDGTLSPLDSTVYRFNSLTGEVRLEDSFRGITRRTPADVGVQFGHSASFREGFQNYRVVYTGGYDANEIPSRLQEACLEIAAFSYHRQRSDPSMQSESLGDYSYSRRSSDELQQRVESMVMPFAPSVLI